MVNSADDDGSQVTDSKADEPQFDWRAFTPADSPKTPMDVMADPRHRDLATATLSAGERAFDFTRPVYDFSNGAGVATGGTFNLLRAAREKPVALIFGSYT